MKIAQRFNAGIVVGQPSSPDQGRLSGLVFIRPFRDSHRKTPAPSVETLGYGRMSLRDGESGTSSKILGPSGVLGCQLRARPASKMLVWGRDAHPTRRPGRPRYASLFHAFNASTL
jgi:hypothetical protein